MRTKVPPGCDCVVYLIAGAPLKLMGSQKRRKTVSHKTKKPNNNYWTHLAKMQRLRTKLHSYDWQRSQHFALRLFKRPKMPV